MVAEPVATTPVAGGERAAAVPAVYAEGFQAGLVGAATIALWFFLLDTIAGRPFYTPNLLGTAWLQGTAALAAPETLPVSFETVLTFTWLHVLAFLLIGIAGAQLVALAEREPNFGFGILLFFVVFEAGFLVVSMLFAEPLLRALAWPAILVGNLLAAAAMATIFWRRHPGLTIRP